MFIQIEETPNPSTLKFLPGRAIMESEGAEFKSSQEAHTCLFAAQILEIKGVTSVFLGLDFVSVTKIEESDWFTLKPLILECIVNYFATHEKVIITTRQKRTSGGVDDEITQQIKELIDTRVRPAVAMDGGDIIFDKFENGVVYLQLQGACSGCPSSSATLKEGIENMLRYYIPEVQEVRPVEHDALV